MSAETIAQALKGQKVGAGWSARCPAHDDQNPSLSLTDDKDGKVLVHCHAGCSQVQVIGVLKNRGLWTAHPSRLDRPLASRGVASASESETAGTKRAEFALSIWMSAQDAAGTLVEAYLASRGLKLPSTPALRFVPYLQNPSGDYLPVMVALVTSGVDGTPLGIHRTFLDPIGAGKASVATPKMMLGPVHGGAVRLAEPDDVLMVGEGIETCLAVMQATGLPAWAALSTSGLRALNLPSNVRDVIVLADGDEAGEQAAVTCASRWKRAGRRVRIARPPSRMDFNDMLVGKVPHTEGGVR